jgi:hypothetical protein
MEGTNVEKTAGKYLLKRRVCRKVTFEMAMVEKK